MSEPVTCECGAHALTGEPVHPHFGVGRVQQAYCFECNMLLYWQDGKPVTQAMVPAVTSVPSRVTPLKKFELLSELRPPVPVALIVPPVIVLPTDGRTTMAIRYALSNNIGLGGHNGAVIFKRYDGD